MSAPSARPGGRHSISVSSTSNPEAPDQTAEDPLQLISELRIVTFAAWTLTQPLILRFSEHSARR